MHSHGKLQGFLCWVGLHPACCDRRSGLISRMQRCKNCGREDMAL